MRRRITEAIVGVSAILLLVLGVPLAIEVHQSILDSEVVELQVVAARTLAEVDVPIDPNELAEVRVGRDGPPPFSVYDDAGTLVFGDGPATADQTVREALAGDPASATNGLIEVASPINDRSTDTVVGALRLTETLDGVYQRSRVAWLEMASIGLVALVLGGLIAKRLARRLSQPFTDLAATAARLGDAGALTRSTVASGIVEIDELATALTEASERINEALARERRFSADVSHQLRTPLTSIRLRLERARSQRDPDLITPALHDLHRLERTVDHLLAFARDAISVSSTVRLDDAARESVERWAERAAAAGRKISASTSGPTWTRGSATSTEQILDVLIDNALHHGAGSVRIAQRRITGGGAIDVSDDGSGIDPHDADRIFERGHGARNGIGLALARSIAEAEGGRLIFARQSPTTFSVILLDAPGDHDDTEEGRVYVTSDRSPRLTAD